MKLYHGTTGTIARKALEDGVQPRRVSKHSGNWEHTVSSNEEIVYLTRSYAPYFAGAASEGPLAEQRWAILEVDVDTLEPLDLYPDEDFLEQVSRVHMPEAMLEVVNAFCDETWWDDGNGNVEYEASFPEALKGGMNARTIWFRENLEMFNHLWQMSIRGLGSCAYGNIIEPDSITRAVEYDPSSNEVMTIMAHDPMISMLNYAILADRYNAATRWYFGDKVMPEDLWFTISPSSVSDVKPLNESLQKFMDLEKSRYKSMQKAIGNRAGIIWLKR